MDTIRKLASGMFIGAAIILSIFVYYDYERRTAEHQRRIEEASPGVRREQLEQLPPNAKNVVGLGNGWLQFELEVKGENKIYLYKGSALSPTK